MAFWRKKEFYRPSEATLRRRALIKTSIGALGVVYGDIGTSPLYAVSACFDPSHGIAPSPENVLGILSLFFWALLLVVSVKYLLFILRADNNHEGGILALVALLNQSKEKVHHWLLLLGLFGAALLYGDGIITPSITVLGAIEGLQVATPAFEPLIVPISVIILLGIFYLQKRGTARIGEVFGPAMLLWFFTIAAAGLPWIARQPQILLALNPAYAIEFMMRNHLHGFLVLAAVVLCITGAEALYADMGHFGKKPIRLGWFTIVFPTLLLNYFGQGALILAKGEEAVRNPFYGLVSGMWIYPLVVISTIAAIIASQALISGAFSITQQAVQLGYLPRLTILHTSSQTEGQIYVPRVNQLLLIGCLALVIGFGDSSKLAAAYGIAVTGTMAITSILYFEVTRRIWNWSLAPSLSLLSVFLTVDFAFFGSNLVKIKHGGWIPLVLGIFIFAIMRTWKEGREVLGRSMQELAMPLDDFLREISKKKPPRVNGTAVFMTLTRDLAPSVLLHHFRHNQALHQKVLLLSIVTKNVPEIDMMERVRVTELEHGFFKVVARYGFMQTPDISEILELCAGSGLMIDGDLSFYLGRETFLTSGNSRMPHWRKKIFIFLSRNARSASEFFKLPADRVIEIGLQIQI